MEAAPISSVSIGNGVTVTFSESDCEVEYGNLKLSPQIFMDDIIRMAASRDSAQYANKLLETLIGKKSLQFNLDKSAFLVMGNKKARNKLHTEIEKSPITLCDKNMNEVKTLSI